MNYSEGIYNSSLSMGGSREGGVQGAGPPFLAHVVGFLMLGPKLDPLLDPPFCL